jgi:methyl-accepting chemotaxis protein
MKIRMKLALLTVGTFVLFGIAVAANFAIQSPAETMAKESDVINRVVLAAKQLQGSANRLMVDSLASGTDGLAASQKAWDEAMAAIGQVHLLPTLNAQVADAFDIIKNLEQLSGPSLKTLGERLEVVKADAHRVLYTGDNGDLIKFYADYIPKTKDHKLDAQTKADIIAFDAAISSVNLNLDAIASTLAEQGAVITTAIGQLRLWSSLVSLTIVLAVLAAGLLGSLLLARSITKSIGELGSKVEIMGTGDLRVNFAAQSRDETGALGANLNHLLFSFQIALGEIQKSATQNAQVKDRLVQVVSDATSSAVEIEANSAAIKSRMEQLDGMIEQSTVKMHTMSESVGTFNDKMNKQNEHIGNSVAAVTQMLASIGNVTRITEKDRDEADKLVQEAEHGREFFESTFAKVAEISESVGLIEEMANVIAGISSQTQILALNAAIEAAHAGDFGKGFAVVADEISKLAEASSSSSDEIARTLSTISVKIREADTTRTSTSQAFSAITSRINTVSQSVVEIHHNIQEMDVGSRQILEAMEELKGGSESVTAEAQGIEAGIGEVSATIETIERISSEVVSNIGEITAGLQEISRSVHAAGGQAQELEAIADVLQTASGRFQIG